MLRYLFRLSGLQVLKFAFLLGTTNVKLFWRSTVCFLRLGGKLLVLLSCVSLLGFSASEGRRQSPVLRIALKAWKECPKRPGNLLTRLASVFSSVKCFHSSVPAAAWGWPELGVYRKKQYLNAGLALTHTQIICFTKNMYFETAARLVHIQPLIADLVKEGEKV